MGKEKQLDLFLQFTEPTPLEKSDVMHGKEEVETNNITVEIINPHTENNTSVDSTTPKTVVQIQEEKSIVTTTIKSSTRGRKSIKEMEASADLIEIPNDEILFGKLYYSMSEVTQMFKVNHSLLRFWEAEFSILKPRKNKKGDRLFRPEDIKNLEIIHHLLRVKKLTIQGAKDYFNNNKKVNQKFETIQKLQKLKYFLLEVKANLG